MPSFSLDLREPVALFVDGHATPAVAGRHFVNLHPATGLPVNEVALGEDDDVDRAVRAAKRAFKGPWGSWPLARRLLALEAVARGIEANAEAFIAAEVSDTGRPRHMAASFDVPRAVDNFRTFTRLAAHLPAESFLTDTPEGGAVSYSLRVPLGVIGLICPWNLPLALLTWKLAPALAAGNTVVVKPSEESPSSATLLGRIIQEAGIPDGVYNVVHGFGDTGASLVRHPEVAAISFTGESGTGQSIMAAAAPGLKKLSFELGGKNPALIFADADLEQAIATTARSVFLHAGQICLCNERIYVERPVFERVVEGIRAAARALKPGDPFRAETTLSPLISASHRDKVFSYFNRTRREGATVVTGGGIAELDEPWRGGFFVEPTVWTGVPAESRARTDEIFGPVCLIEPFDAEEQALAAANDSQYGLSATVWTSNAARANRLARQLDVGTVWINTWLIRDLRMPFGGTKRSGLGREGGVHSFEFFTELRSIISRF
ncbi:aldehyde dehydrogenase family protein [Melittangium boletus]|uniref:2-hydroxymuconic semialdehyde dehydrogenase n=1 Tax=Melittangium boletus DSM 14713 TaxID=1294270 RepID=A0A250IQZ2_9BACT|nr:aldehyde dehydrogenase family protein [Melittangium boletus]ATB34154.1 2-hydroxymuconic semialdehyde dehydrogenase [Melittangium boletus DSM 14713]